MRRLEATAMSHSKLRVHLLRYCIIALTLGLMLTPATVGASPGVAADGIYDPAHGCINYQTTLPSVRGPQYIVYSPAGASGAAHAAANVIQGRKVFQVYEKGLGISSLLQPGQSGRFPVFIDPAYTSNDGEFTHLCHHDTWAAAIINGRLGGDHLNATVYHELFHAAQWALLRNLTVPDNWWYEATATAAEAWFGSSDHLRFAPRLTDHAVTPMDNFDASKGHAYGAYLFVQWAMQSAAMPSGAGWAFLRASIKDTAPDVDAGLNRALANLTPPSPCAGGVTRFACDIASFWGDETNQTGPSPKFGPPAKGVRDVIKAAEETHTIPTSKEYGAVVFKFVPGGGRNQMEVNIPTVPDGVEIWINFGHGHLQAVRPGESFDETFCRSGHVEGTYPLPPSGDVRMAMTTTTSHAPADITVKFHTSTKCETHGIMVVRGGGTVAAVFHSLTCRRAVPAKNKPFLATATSGAYKLQATINKFNGFHNYPVDFKSTDPSFVLDGPGGPFSNVYWPGGTPPSHGGYITFTSDGGIMGLGFYNAWNANFSDAVAIAGTATCNYTSHK